MATVATIFKRTSAAVLPGELPRTWSEEYDPYQLRPLPCEDVYLFAKKIDNSRVVREADPAARRRCWRTLSMSLFAALALMMLMLPDALGMFAGYQLHALERNREKLAAERAALALEEGRMLSPEQLRQWARELKLVDPQPQQVVHLDPVTEGALAMKVSR